MRATFHLLLLCPVVRTAPGVLEFDDAKLRLLQRESSVLQEQAALHLFEYRARAMTAFIDMDLDAEEPQEPDPVIKAMKAKQTAEALEAEKLLKIAASKSNPDVEHNGFAFDGSEFSEISFDEIEEKQDEAEAQRMDSLDKEKHPKEDSQRKEDSGNDSFKDSSRNSGHQAGHQAWVEEAAPQSAQVQSKAFRNQWSHYWASKKAVELVEEWQDPELVLSSVDSVDTTNTSAKPINDGRVAAKATSVSGAMAEKMEGLQDQWKDYWNSKKALEMDADEEEEASWHEANSQGHAQLVHKEIDEEEKEASRDGARSSLGAQLVHDDSKLAATTSAGTTAEMFITTDTKPFAISVDELEEQQQLGEISVDELEDHMAAQEANQAKIKASLAEMTPPKNPRASEEYVSHSSNPFQGAHGAYDESPKDAATLMWYAYWDRLNLTLSQKEDREKHMKKIANSSRNKAWAAYWTQKKKQQEIVRPVQAKNIALSQQEEIDTHLQSIVNSPKNKAWAAYWTRKKEVARDNQEKTTQSEPRQHQQDADPVSIKQSDKDYQMSLPAKEAKFEQKGHPGPISLIDHECIIVGDTHLVGFDHGDASASNKKVYNVEGDAWIVKSPLVLIQGRFNRINDKWALRGLAVGGPFLGGNVLLIGGHTQNSKISWNEEEILGRIPSEYRNKFIQAKYYPHAQLVQDATRASENPGLEITFPLGVRLFVNRGKDGLGVMIKMHRLGNVQDGQCGNFNGNPLDDSADLISDRIGNQIPSSEVMFRHAFVHDTTLSELIGECKIYGDPHIVGFDQAALPIITHQVSLLEQGVAASPQSSGDTWLVKSSQVHIQGRFNIIDDRQHSFLTGIAVGGPFLNGNVLLIAGQHGDNEGRIFWNKDEILKTVPSEFRNELISAKLHDDIELVQDPLRKAQRPGFDIYLPMDVKLSVNRGKHGLGLSIRMRKLLDQDGQCGNFNGNSADETVELISQRVGHGISPHDLLFRHPFVPAAPKYA